MIGVDATVLALAVNRYAPEHPRAARTLEELANGERGWALPWVAVHDFLRRVTHPHGAARPLRSEDALGWIEILLESASVHLLSPGPAHLAAVRRVLASARPSGAPPAGLELAAVLEEHGVRELLTTYRALRRFATLTVIDPVHGPGWTPERPPARRYRVLGGR